MARHRQYTGGVSPCCNSNSKQTCPPLLKSYATSPSQFPSVPCVSWVNARIAIEDTHLLSPDRIEPPFFLYFFPITSSPCCSFTHFPLLSLLLLSPPPTHPPTPRRITSCRAQGQEPGSDLTLLFRKSDVTPVVTLD